MITETRKPPLRDDDIALELVACIAPEVELLIIDWHFIDQVLNDNWDCRLVELLRFLAEPTPGTTAVDAIGDIETEPVIDLTTLLHDLEAVDFSGR